jgi:hypothetical protein
MALKPDRIEFLTDISNFMNTTAERGGVVSFLSSGVGASMDDGNAVVGYATLSSGTVPAGILLNDVVNYDLTKQHINWMKDEMQVGGKVTLLKIGQVTTDMVVGSPVAGNSAYVGPSGLVSVDSTNSIRVGTFLSGKDSDGFVKLSVNLQ